MALDIIRLQLSSKAARPLLHRQDETKDYISALWSQYQREKADSILGHMVQYDNPLPQESIDLAPQVEAQQHAKPTRTVTTSSASEEERKHDTEMIGKQVAWSLDEGSPVVISKREDAVQSSSNGSSSGTAPVREERRELKMWNRPPSDTIEQLVHMAFTVS